jgi:CRISP-associated protein Cas1
MDNERLCLRCSLAPVCLPEEERLARDAGWEPVRLFPGDTDRQTVHITVNGACVSRAGEALRMPKGVEHIPTHACTGPHAHRRGADLLDAERR